MEKKECNDCMKAKHVFSPQQKILEKFIFYEEYMKARDLESWFRSADVPMKEVFLLFGFLITVEPDFRGTPEEFLLRYRNVFSKIKAFRESRLIQIELPDTIKSCIASIFDELSHCGGEDRVESNAASIIMHVLIPDLFVIWDDRKRETVLGDTDKKDGRSYAFEFLPRMQFKAKTSE